MRKWNIIHKDSSKGQKKRGIRGLLENVNNSVMGVGITVILNDIIENVKAKITCSNVTPT